jgi:chromate transporter
MMSIGAAAFAGIFLFRIPFPAIVLGAALAGWVGGRRWPERFQVIRPKSVDEPDGAHAPTRSAPSSSGPARTFRTVLIWGAIWIAPFPILALLGAPPVLHQEAVFFSQAAIVTFGGAYAVLAYIAQEAVQRHGWLLPGEMLDGLGLAETTPGPLIMVVQFVGFLGAYRNPGGLDPLLAGAMGAVVTTWVTFAPCFLWIFAGAPYVERLRDNRRLTAGLSAITAAVVGVILNLAVWFALNLLFAETQPFAAAGLRLDVPVPHSVDPAAVMLTAAAIVATFRFRVGMLKVLAATAGLGAAIRLLGG